MKVYAATSKKKPMATNRDEILERIKTRQAKRDGIKEEEVAPLTNAEIRALVKAVIVMAYYAWSPNAIPKSKLDHVIQIGNDALPVVQKTNTNENGYISALNEITQDGMIDQSAGQFQVFLKATLKLQKDLQSNYKVAPALFQLLDYSRRMAGGSESAKVWVEKNVGVLKDPFLTSIFTKTVAAKPQDLEDLEGLAKLVKAMGGKGYNLGPTERKAAAAKYPAYYQEFIAARRALSDQAKDWARNYVRATGDADGLVPYDRFWSAMGTAGIKVHNFVAGFVGFVDDKGALYTTAKRKVAGSPNGGKALMNPNYDAENDVGFVFKADIPGALTQPYYFTENHKERSTKKKFSAVSTLADDIAGIRKKWLATLRSGDIEDDQHDPDFLAAMALEIVFQTQARIGSLSNATKDAKTGEYKQTYGLTTIEMRHVRRITGGLRIMYEGKAAFKGEEVNKQRHVLLSAEHSAIKKIVTALLTWKDERDSDEYVFQTARGGALSASYVNKFFRRCGANTTVHKLRTLKGTIMMNDIVAKHPWKGKKKASSSNEVMKWLREKAEAIGKQLGHVAGGSVTGVTALQNYCDPNTMATLFKEASVMIHPTILKLTKADGAMQGIDD